MPQSRCRESKIHLHRNLLHKTSDNPDCLGLAIEFGPPERLDGWTRWIQQHDTYFGDIQATLGIPIILYADKMDSAWQSIRVAAQNSILTVRKVHVVRAT